MDRLEKHKVRTDANFKLEDTLYNTYVNSAQTRLDKVALYVDDTKKSYTHREFLRLVDRASVGFKNLGISNQSKAGLLLNGSIEDAVTFLALNKLGAVCKFIDFMKSVPAMKHSVDETDLDVLVMDECFLPLDEFINVKRLRVIVANSAKRYDGTHYISYSQLFTHKNYKKFESVPYVDGKPTIMINSSGTTGEPKPIVHSDYTINAAAQKMLYTDYPITEGNVLIKMIP